jgi:hypothetical protein
MPRRRPRVGRSVVDRKTWGVTIPAGQPPDQFTLTFNDAPGPVRFNYTYNPGGGAPPVSLLDLIVADDDDDHAPPSIDAWAGLAQPLEIQCGISPGAAARLPPDFECRFTHAHRRWADVDELGDGNFRGLVRGMHQHVFRMDEFVLAEVEVAPGLPESRWFARHVH